jgi:hypothetical protein
VSCDKGTIAADHVPNGKKSPIGRDDPEEIGGQSCDAGFRQYRRQSFELLVNAERRTSDETMEIGTFGEKRVEPIEVLLDGVDGFVLESELEKSGGVTPGHSRDDRFLACHWRTLVAYVIHRLNAVADWQRKQLEFKREFRLPGTSQEPRGNPLKSRAS